MDQMIATKGSSPTRRVRTIASTTPVNHLMQAGRRPGNVVADAPPSGLPGGCADLLAPGGGVSVHIDRTPRDPGELQSARLGSIRFGFQGKGNIDKDGFPLVVMTSSPLFLRNSASGVPDRNCRKSGHLIEVPDAS